MSAARVLLVDDDANDRAAFTRAAVEQNWPYTVCVATSFDEAKWILGHEEVDAIVADYRFGDHTAFELLDLKLDARTIITTGTGNEEIAARSMRAGAEDYLVKDMNGGYLKRLPVVLERAIGHKKSEEKVRFLRSRESEDVVMVGGEAFDETIKMVELAAQSMSPVLITGETGTGKNLVAKAIHFRSPLSAAHFVSINCAALPDNLVEGELFGYEKGAFTGAVTAKKGLLELAEGGTLLLDELGEMPVHIQSKLLGVLDDRRVRRLGSESARHVNVRFIAATSVDVEHAIGTRIRSDLFYRLSVIRITLAPLRERPDDLPDLCHALLRRLTDGGEATISDAEMERLKAYAWPGNIRELRNILERALIVHRGAELRPSLLLGTTAVATPARPERTRATAPVQTLAEVERDHIAATFDRHAHNITQTARALGISVSTLKRKIRTYRLL